MPSFQKPSFGKSRRNQAGALAPDEAEAIGLSALLFLTEDEARLTRFLSETGLSPADLGAAAARPEMLGAVLDYLLADESLLLVFAAHAAIEPGTIAPAQAALAKAG